MVLHDSYKITLARIINFIFNLLVIFLITKLYDIHGEGLYSLILSSFAILTQISVFGIDQILLNKYSSQEKLYNSASIFHSFIFAPIVYLLFLPIGYLFYHDIQLSKLMIFLLGVAFASNTYILFENPRLIVKKMINRYVVFIVLRPIILLISLIVLKYLFSTNDAIIVSISFSWFFVAILLFINSKDKNCNIKYYLLNWRNVIKYSSWIYFTSLIFILNSKSLVLLIKYFGDIKKSGILFLALMGVDILNYIPGAFGDIFLRDINEKDDKILYLRYTYSKVLYILIAMALIGLPIYYFSLSLLSDIFKNAFVPFVIILPSAVFIYASRVIGSYFLSINKMYYSTISVLINLIVVVVSGLILIPMKSVDGASISIALGYISSVIFDYVILIKEIGFVQFVKIFIHPRITTFLNR